MKKRQYLLYVFLLMVLISVGCSRNRNVTVIDGTNSYYEELNCLVIGEYEFHLGDTLRQIEERYQELSLPEEKQLPDKDSKEGAYVTEYGQRVMEYMEIADIDVVYDSKTQYPLLSATVVNNTGGETSSYDLPVSRYQTENSAAEIPGTILALMREHKEDEEWSFYNPDTLCFVKLTSEKQNDGLYMLTALVSVYEDETYQKYLQYNLEGMLVIRTEDDITRLKEDLKTIGRLDEMTEKEKAKLDEKERFNTTYLSVKSVLMGLPQADKTRDYGNQVLDFVDSGRNCDYFMTKGEVTYSILEPYSDLLQNQDLVYTMDHDYTFQPVMDTLGAYGNNVAADTAWYTLGETEEDSELLVLPAITNFTERTIGIEEGRVAQVRQFGGDYDSVVLPENVEAAITEYWLNGEPTVTVYEYEKEQITVSYTGLSQDGGAIRCCVDVIPADYPEITIRYNVMVSLDDGNVTDAEFGLKEYS